MTNSGLRTVDYETGWSNRTDVAARRAVMTGLTQVTAKVNENNAEKLGTDMFEVSWHSGARPSHQVWQGRWYKSSELESVCGLGSVTGLCGANCYHSYYPVIPGISVPTYAEEELDEMNRQENIPIDYNGKQYTKYEALQRQRQLETRMRAERQKIKLLQDGEADETDIMLARAKYRGTSQEYTSFSKAMDLPQQRQRVAIDGLENIGVGKWKIPVEKSSKSGIIELERMRSSSDYAVPKDLVSSREFRSKFDSMDTDKHIQREYYQAVKEMLTHRSGNNGEDLLYYNTVTNKWYKSTTGTAAGTPDYTKEILQALRESNPNEIVSFHNHPLGMPPSDGDLNAALANGYKKGYTIGHNGVIFEYTPPKYKIPESAYMINVERFKKQGMDEFEAQLATLNELKKLYGFSFREVE